MDDSVRCLHVGGHYARGAVEVDLAALEGEPDRLTLDGLDLQPLLGRSDRGGGGDALADDVIGEHGLEELLVGGDLVVEVGVLFFRLAKAWSVGAKTVRLPGAESVPARPAFLTSATSVLNLPARDRGLDDVLLARGRRFRG